LIFYLRGEFRCYISPQGLALAQPIATPKHWSNADPWPFDVLGRAITKAPQETSQENIHRNK
jgi:hypothetical protein